MHEAVGTRTLVLATVLAAGTAGAGRVTFQGAFAPAEAWVQPAERPCRDSVCLNGAWQFQPVAVPPAFVRGAGVPPELPPPRDDGWEATPIRIPSPWNVNTWGCGRQVGAGTERLLWPDSVYFPSYPSAWDNVEMGWLQRAFDVPAAWAGRRLVLHFEAVAGDCQVWVNGRLAGTHFDSYLPFELDITRFAKAAGPNELRLGIRAHALFDKRSARYPKMRAPYPCGSETAGLVGIWQDVHLLALPPVRVADVFVQPQVDADTLLLEVTLRNDGPRAETVRLGGDVHPWVNRAGAAVLDAPAPRGELAPAVLALPATNVAIGAGAEARVVLRAAVGGRLELWAPGTPRLYTALLALSQGERVADRHATRFGWRQFTLRGRELRLNGRPLQLTGDFLHPFGPFVLSRRYVWAWYCLIQDFGGNAVRPHAQPHPRHYLDLADEMGLVVLDESALFGSSIALNFEAPEAWERFAAHTDGLVQRDRNHPSVLGWSVGNELFAIFEHNAVPPDVAADWYRRLAALGARARALDPTRDWISCDGDEDLRGALPVWSKHFGHGTPLERLPALDKPLMVGESGGTYYARPRQLAEFNGARAYESYAGRNEALAIDVYDNIVRMARPRLAFYSASETAWFGVEHLPYGCRDGTRLPGRDDGVFFTRPLADGAPGFQPERLPPYVATLNPGWDPALPLYRPLAMFHAQQAALAPGGPRPCQWDHRVAPPVAGSVPSAVAPPHARATFVGARDGALARRLTALGVPLAADGAAGFTIVDADTLAPAALEQARRALAAAAEQGGTVLVVLASGRVPDGLLPAALRITDRAATALVPDGAHPWTAPFALPDLYFAEEGAERFIQRRGLDGPLLDGARVLLRASDTDWSLFNHAPENAKCAALLLGERLAKPAGAALLERPLGRGRLAVTTLEPRSTSRATRTFWRALLTNMGLALGAAADVAPPAFDDRDALVQALAAGRFGAADVEAALATDFVGEATVRPAGGAEVAGVRWQPVESPSRDRFIVRQMRQAGPTNGAFAVYFSFWINSPRALDDLLAGGPDAPRYTLFAYASEKCRLFVNGREHAPARTEPADYRTRYSFERLPLQKAWNHLLVKVAGRYPDGDQPVTLAVRQQAAPEEYLRQAESAIEHRPAAER